MAQKQLLQLPKTQFSGLDFSNILEDVYNLVRENPKYNENWDDFLSSNAGVMLTEIFAWMTEQLATRIDWVVNENFIGTATQRSSIINLLKLIGYKFLLPVASEVPVDIAFSANNGEFLLTPGYSAEIGTFSPKTLTAKDKKGNTKYFEAIEYDVVASKYLYDIEIKLNTSNSLTFNVPFYEGRTKVENFVSTTNQGQKFLLSEKPIIRNSIRVSKIIITGNVGSETIDEEVLLEVDSFLSLKAQKSENPDGSINPIPYVINVLEDDAVEIAFGPSSLLSDQDRRLTEGSSIRVLYRVGGGIDGDISRGAINVKEDVDNNGVKATVTFKNNTEGVGAENSETIEHAAYVGPLQIKTAGKTVTEEDYDIILSSFVNVLLSKAYGHNNLPSDFYEKYGIYISPLEVLNFIALKKSGWETIPTSKYKYANWGTLNLENYFNEKISFNSGSFGNLMSVNSNNDLTQEAIYDYNHSGGRTFNNFMIISTPPEWKDILWIVDPNDENLYIANPDAKASLTKNEYDPLLHHFLEDIDDHFVANDGEEDPFFYGDYNNTGLPKEELSEDIHAYMESKKNTALGIYIGNDYLTGPNLLLINIDNHGDVNIDLSEGGQNITSITQQEAVDIINKEFGNAYDGIFSYQDLGIKITHKTDIVEALEDHDMDDWYLVVDGYSYVVNLGSIQSYEKIVEYINNSFQSAGTQGYQDFENNGAWGVVDGTEYELKIEVNGSGTPINVKLPAVSDNTLDESELVELLNYAFTKHESSPGVPSLIKAIAKVDVSGAVRVYANDTGVDSSINITAGDNNDLLSALSVTMQAAVSGTGISGANLEAFFVESQINTACFDIRISRTNPTGVASLSDSGTSVDLLAGLGALPLTTSPIAYGNYSNVASIINYGGSAKYIKLTSPTKGQNSIIVNKLTASGLTRDASPQVFGLEFSLSGITEYTCFGRRRLTIIYDDTDNPQFGDFIYEHGSIHFNLNDPQYIYLNFLDSKKDTVKLGSYYTDNFIEGTDPEWKLPAHRLYNTIYKEDLTSVNPNAEVIDYEVSDFMLKFSRKETNSNSIYTINEDLNLEKTKNPTITSIDLTNFPDMSGKYLKISINGYTDITANVNSITSIDGLVSILNANWNVQAQDGSFSPITFATKNEDNTKIILETGDRTNSGKLVIYDDEGTTLIGAEIFGTEAGKNTTIYPGGDYYLQHFRPQFDSEPPLTQEEIDALTPEEKFGYFNMIIITGTDNNIPDLDFYAHLVNDRRHKFKDETVYRLHTDEDDIREVLYQYKIAGVDNSFTRPVFSTFDCKANIYIETAASKEQVKKNVENSLRKFYSIENTVLSKNVNKSEFIGIVLNVSGVRFIDIEYFGHSIKESSIFANEDLEIEVGFDEILVLSDDVYDSSGEQNGGLLFEYKTL